MAQKLYTVVAFDPKNRRFEDTISARDRSQAKTLFEAKYNGRCRILTIREGN